LRPVPNRQVTSGYQDVPGNAGNHIAETDHCHFHGHPSELRLPHKPVAHICRSHAEEFPARCTRIIPAEKFDDRQNTIALFNSEQDLASGGGNCQNWIAGGSQLLQFLSMVYRYLTGPSHDSPARSARLQQRRIRVAKTETSRKYLRKASAAMNCSAKPN